MKPELLALLLKKDFWDKYGNLVEREMFSDHSLLLYDSVVSYHEKYTDDLDREKLWEVIKTENPTLTSANKSLIYQLVDDIKEASDWTEDFARDILNDVWRRHTFAKIAEIGIQGSQGKVTSLDAIQDLLEKSAGGFIQHDNITECDLDIDELLELDANTKSWAFNIPALHEAAGTMYGGLFLQVMARPDAGKTAFIINMVAGPDGWAKQGAQIDWYGNEEPIKRTRWRAMSSYSGMIKERLIENKEAARAAWADVKDNIHMFDIPDGTPVELIHQRTKERKPDIVIVDQLDKLSVTGDVKEFSNEAARLRRLYTKFRAIGKEQETLQVGVCQASADAEGSRIVTYDQAENSKTGKAAECDLFLGLGKEPMRSEDLMYGDVEESTKRYITASKNKLDSGWKGTVTVELIPALARYQNYREE